ncbi:hypothetical protein LP420_18890 [Massilia sp. B-10]|nr:hypothetical protein LP420_18890 [Massilia sp. B-10]
MRIDYLSSDILLFRGDSLAALATAFIDGERVLLVDALASQFDALDMRDYLENTLRKQVAQIVLTDAVSMATVRRWPCSPPRKSRARRTRPPSSAGAATRWNCIRPTVACTSTCRAPT